jgi:hypothetical protein
MCREITAVYSESHTIPINTIIQQHNHTVLFNFTVHASYNRVCVGAASEATTGLASHHLLYRSPCFKELIILSFLNILLLWLILLHSISQTE